MNYMPCKIVADDYGRSDEVNCAISELVNKNIVSKVSVMANESIKYLMSDIGKDIEVGLHISLTSYSKGPRMNQNKKISLLKLLYFIYARHLNINQIVDDIKNQHEVLEYRGFKISYLDTHQHIHIIPKALKSLIIFAKTKGIYSIRCITIERRYLFFYLYSLIRFGFLTQVPKMIFLYSMGTLMKLKLDKAKINYCKNLVLMPLATSGDYSGLLKEFLNRFKDVGAEIVTHPGLKAKTINTDNYSAGRYIEYCSLKKIL